MIRARALKEDWRVLTLAIGGVTDRTINPMTIVVQASCGMPHVLGSRRVVWADGGYAGRLVDFASESLALTLTIVKRPNDSSGFTVLPRRWCVERTLAWLIHRRRLVRDYERLP